MKIKKIIPILLCAVMIISSVLCLNFLANAQTNPTIYSNMNGSTVNVEETIRIPVSIKDNTGLLGWMLSLDYDPDVLTPISVDYGDVISGGIQDNIEGDSVPGSFIVYWAGSENNYSDGVLFYINATIDTTAIGKTSIQIRYSQPDTFDEDFNDVKLNCESIEFTIMNSSYSKYAKVTSNASNVVAGENVAVKLNISEISAINKISLNLSYDAENFSFVSATSSADLTFNDIGGVTMLNIKNITSALNDTDFVTLIYKSDDKAKSGKYTFNLSSEDEGIICKSCSVTISPSKTSEVAEISIPQGIVIEKNEVAQIPVIITNNHGIMGYRLTFNYNPDEIEILSVKRSIDFSGEVYDSLGNKPSTFDVLWNFTSEIKTDGTLFIIEVKNISDSFSESSISISYSQEDTFNEKYDDVVFDCKNATIILCPRHSYTQNTVNATCTEKGYTEYVCEYCSNTYQSDYTDDIGHYYRYTGNGKDFVMTYECVDCDEKLSINADEVYTMWDAQYINVRPNSVDNRTKTDNSSLLNVILDSHIDDGIINAKDYALLTQLNKSHNND